jgi:hypothetical protein
MRVTATFAVSKNIELYLPDAGVELLRKRQMPVVQAVEQCRIPGLPQCLCARSKTGVITIVGSDDLNLIDAQLIVLLGAGRQNAEQKTQGEKRER